MTWKAVIQKKLVFMPWWVGIFYVYKLCEWFDLWFYYCFNFGIVCCSQIASFCDCFCDFVVFVTEFVIVYLLFCMLCRLLITHNLTFQPSRVTLGSLLNKAWKVTPKRSITPQGNDTTSINLVLYINTNIITTCKTITKNQSQKLATWVHHTISAIFFFFSQIN